MTKLVKLTSNIDLDLPASKFDLRSWKMWMEPTFIFYSEYFGVLNVEIDEEMAKLVKLTSNIDLDLLTFVFDLRSWNMLRGTHIYILFRVFWCIKRWNR